MVFYQLYLYLIHQLGTWSVKWKFIWSIGLVLEYSLLSHSCYSDLYLNIVEHSVHKDPG